LLSVYALPGLAAYPEKNIEFVVGYKPGGGYSDWAQAIAPFIEKHMPNKVNVVVRHMDGAGSAIAANYMQKAKPDGYTIAIYNIAGLAATQLARKVQYDLPKVTWLARVSYDDTVAVVKGKGPYKSIEDFKKQTKPEYVVSTKGLAATNTITGAVTFTKMGVKWKPLNHAGTGESVLAVIRGDADITWGSFESLQQYIDSGDLKLVVYYDSKRNPKFPDVPIPAEVGMPELNESMNSHRLLGAPPGLPADVRTVLEGAIKKAVEDPGFAEAVKKMKRTPAFLDGKQCTALVKDVLQSYETYAGIVKALLSQDKQ
jgi:tripartite-type tricarboxylate transporter receptor subunit TctC